jgi:hypothetical protein
MRLTFLALLASLAVIAAPTTARADNAFHRIPGKGSKLELKVVAYDGSTNGELTVAVKNTGSTAMKFSASGLYFVPDGDADEAPQRLGAVGPMQLASDKDGEPSKDAEARRKDSITIPAGKTVKVTLDVFCIDSHRSSPTSSTPFTVGKTRMPKALAAKIDRQARKAIADEDGGFAAPAAKDKIQAEVWKTRDAKWIDLDGEGAQEATK